MSATADPAAAPETPTAPEDLFRPGTDDRAWFVFHARPRCEKKAAQSCRNLQIRHYLPLYESRHRRGKRSYSFDVPLFPGYLFGCCDCGQRVALLRSGYLVRAIDVLDQERLLDELHNIYLACQGAADLTLFPQLKRGRQIRVLRGPLAGVYGRISKRKEALRLVLNVSILGAAVAAEVDMEDVELI